MDLKETKEELESYWFDYQYILEKSKENDSLKLIVNQTCSRLESINNTIEDKGIQDSMDAVIKNQLREEEIFLKIMQKKQNIEQTINRLSQPYKTVLYLKYMRFLNFDQIADRMQYSTKRIYQLHSEALNLFDQTYKENNQDIAESI